MNRNLTPVRWVKVKVGDISNVVSGKRPPVVKDTQVPSANVPIYGGAGKTGYTEQPLFSEPILITGRVGALGLLHKVTIPSWPSDNTLVIKPDCSAVHFEYLFYCLVKRIRELASFNRGTSNPLIVQGDVKSLEIMMPPLPEQRAIAAILGALDDKIELNRRMNQTLEAMAQALFKSWFVDFEPFRDQSMQDSPLGEIPVGWWVGKLGDIADNQRRGVQPNQISSDTPYIGLEHMPRHCITLAEWGKASDIQSNKFEFKRGEILFGKLRPYFHKVGIAPVDGVCSTDILVVTPKEHEWFGLVLGYIFSDKFVNYTDAASTGTKMPRTNWDDVARYGIVLPPKHLAEAFTEHIRPLIDRITVNIYESHSLASIRDTLLPKLLSGEIRVKDAERFVGEGTRVVEQRTQAIYTIGHSNHSLEEFIRLLKRHDITAVADVRSSPVSKRNPQFNRDVLSTALRKENISYLFMGRELGGRPDDPSCYDNGQADYLKMAEKPTFKEGINRLLRGKDRHRTVLLCAEKEPLDCHRTIFVSSNLYQMGIPIKHILANGEIEDHRDTEQRLVKSLGIGNELFDYSLTLTERIEKAYREQARKIAYRLHNQEDNNEY